MQRRESTIDRNQCPRELAPHRDGVQSRASAQGVAVDVDHGEMTNE
jgi:hypothetical protein